MDFSIKKIQFGPNQYNFIPVFDEDKRILTALLGSEYRNFAVEINEALDKVLENDAITSFFSGNVVAMSVNGETVTIESVLDGADIGENCIIQTEELKNLIEEFEERKNRI